MSLVTNASQASSNVAIRLEKLQNLYQVLTKNEPNQRISKVFAKLEKIDRQAVRTMSPGETIGRKYIINKIAMRNAVERHMMALKKPEQPFQTGVVKDQTKSQGALPNSSKQQRKNPLVKLLQDVLAENVLPFLTREEATIGRKYIKIAMKNAVERHMVALKKAKRAFQTGVVKDQTKSQGALTNSSKQQSKNPLVKLPQDVLAENVLPFLTREEATNFQTACVGYSSLTASRFHRLNNFSRAIAQDQAKIPVLFQELHKDDRTRILANFGKENFDWNQMKGRKEPLLKMIEVMKAERSFTIPSSKSLVNHLPKLPIPLMSASVGSFLTEKERGDLRSSCRDTRKIQSASSIIKTYHLEDLIETYLHVSSSALTPSDKAKTLHKLMSMAYSLSEIEELPRPSYSSLPAFFQEVEARNLIRMIEAIRNARPLRNLPAEIEDLHIPKDSAETMQKADRLRDWIHQHQRAIAAIDDLNFRMISSRLSLLPKEIGQLQALKNLYLDSGNLVSVPKEIGQLKALQGLRLDSNRLVSGVPKEIGQLKALIWLDLKNNRLVSIPKEIGQLKALEWLYLENNRLVSIPKEIGQLKALKLLHLDNNLLISVPKEIGQLKALKWLHLNNNRLVSIPKEIGQLKALEQLHLDDNLLVSVPKEIGQLKAFYYLSLKNNGLISLPLELDRFKGDLKKQNKQLQVKNILRQLSLCVTGQHNTKKIASLLDTMEELLGKETRSQLHRCLYEVTKEAAKADKTLHEKLKDKQFGRKAFLDGSIDPKLKAAAIATFRKTLGE